MNPPVANGNGSRSRWSGIVHVRTWIGRMSGETLRADLIAGLTLAAYLLPSALGDASLAGLPPQAGLYACLGGGLVFWLFCSSRHTAVSVTSAISLLLGTTLGGLAHGDPARYAALAAGVAILTGFIAFLAWLARAGSAVCFISESVMVGFKTGVALHLASTQLPKLCGVKGGHGDFWERMHVFLHHAGETNMASLMLGLAALGLLILGKKFLPHKPVALFVVVGGIVLASFVDLGHHGVKLLGAVPDGLPVPAWPAISWVDFQELLPLALACFMLAAVETAAIARMFAAKHGYRVDNNQELLALAGSNLAAGLSHGFPIGGGMSQSLVNESGGARTALSGLISALLIAVVALFLSDALANLPQPVLAAVVLMAVASLVKISELRHLWKVHRSEFLVAVTALLGVLWAGLLKGVLVGAIISLVIMIRRVSSPHVAILGRIPGTRRYSDLERHPDNEPIPGILAFRVEAGIVYFNAEYIFDSVLNRIAVATEPVRLVICDLSASPRVDMAGARMLADLHGELARRGITLRLVEALASVRDMLRVEGLEAKVGKVDRFTSLAHAIDDFRASEARVGG